MGCFLDERSHASHSNLEEPEALVVTLSNRSPNIYVYTHMLLSALLREMSFSVGTSESKHLWLARVLRPCDSWHSVLNGTSIFPPLRFGEHGRQERRKKKRDQELQMRCETCLLNTTRLLHSRICRRGNYSDKIKSRVRPPAFHHICRRNSYDLTRPKEL